MENQTEIPPLSCCPLKSKLICVSAGLVALVIVAAASFVLGRALPRGPEGTLRGAPTIAILPTPTPTPDETANWKTYTNTKYGISFKYPETWFFKDATESSPGSPLVAIAFFTNEVTPYISTGEGSKSNEVLYLYILNPKNGDKIMTQTKDQFIQTATLLNEKNITLDGHPANYDPNSKSYFIWYNDGIQINIISFNDGVEAGKYIDIIVSTFKFLD